MLFNEKKIVKVKSDWDVVIDKSYRSLFLRLPFAGTVVSQAVLLSEIAGQPAELLGVEFQFQQSKYCVLHEKKKKKKKPNLVIRPPTTW